jgi:hypothetical protein
MSYIVIVYVYQTLLEGWMILLKARGEEAKKLYKSTADCAMQILKKEG